MNELKIIYEIVTSVWKLFKKYGCRCLEDGQWDRILKDGQELAQQFRQHGEEFYLLFYDLYAAVRKYYRRKGGWE